jgi:HK97 family phage portal protein
MDLLKVFKIFRKSNEQQTVTTPTSGIHRSYSMIDLLLRQGSYDLAASRALYYYKTIAPIYTVVDMIAANVSTVPPLLYDTKKRQYVENHPFYDLVKNPNADSTWKEFMRRLTIFFLITGNAYAVADGPINKPPISVSVTPSQSVSPIQAMDGYPESFTVNRGYEYNYKRNMKNQRFKYYNQNKRELYQIKTFNPDSVNYDIVGLSMLNPVFYEMEQYLSASKHNLSLLSRGAKLGGIFTSKDILNQDMFDRLKQQISDNYAGSGNAGSIMLADGNLEFTPAGQSNKDMDFVELKKMVEKMMYKVFRIPLALIVEDSMTLSNMESSRIIFYHNVILPMLDRLYEELTLFLIGRYENSENLIITYDENQISALEPLRLQNIQARKDIGANTINELRAMLNDKKLDAGADQLYQSSSNIPYAETVDKSNG